MAFGESTEKVRATQLHLLNSEQIVYLPTNIILIVKESFQYLIERKHCHQDAKIILSKPSQFGM